MSQQFPIKGDESIMSKKEHGTSHKPVQQNLKFNVDRDQADRICNFNRHYAEHSGYLEKLNWSQYLNKNQENIFYDSVTGKPLFIAPKNRTFEEFIQESKSHGWPSFRDQEVVWENVRILNDGEAVGLEGTHLGHNIPDSKGNRYCINLVSIAGQNKDNQKL